MCIFVVFSLDILWNQSEHGLCVRGSYSARVPKSSLAGVHREFVHHTVEEEAESQEDEQDDRRDSGQQEEEREKSRRIKHTT